MEHMRVSRDGEGKGVALVVTSHSLPVSYGLSFPTSSLVDGEASMCYILNHTVILTGNVNTEFVFVTAPCQP